MSFEALCALWLNRRVSVCWHLPSCSWWPARVTWISDDARMVELTYEGARPDGTVRSWSRTGDLGSFVQLAWLA